MDTTSIQQEYDRIKPLLDEFRVEKWDQFPRYKWLIESDFMTLARGADISNLHGFTSNRPIIGVPLAKTKNLINRIMRYVIRTWFRNQIVFNDHVVFLAHRVMSLEARLAEVERELRER